METDNPRVAQAAFSAQGRLSALMADFSDECGISTAAADDEMVALLRIIEAQGRALSFALALVRSTATDRD